MTDNKRRVFKIKKITRQNNFKYIDYQGSDIIVDYETKQINVKQLINYYIVNLQKTKD